MSTPLRLAAFVAGLAVVLVAALGVGRAVGPIDVDDDGDSHGHDAGPAHAGTAGHDAVPPGLSSAVDGYALRLASSTHPRGERAPFSFTIEGPDGLPVTEYDTAHEKDLHLIVVRRDASGFHHVHPELADDGTWTVDLDLPDAGSWKAFADFVPAGGEPLTLAADFSVAGEYRPRPLPAPRTTTTVDGYTVTLDGTLAAGTHSELTFTVERDGKPVDDLQPYLGAYGHLVALRASDLAYLHVHPDGEPGDGSTRPGPQVSFAAEVPTDGAYRVYLDFKHRGKVRTAELTVNAGGVGAPPAGDDAGHGHGEGAHTHDH